MILHNTSTVTKGYSGTSKFEFWQKLIEGSILTTIVVIEPIRRRRAGLYATDVKMEANGLSFTCSITEAANYLSKIEYE